MRKWLTRAIGLRKPRVASRTESGAVHASIGEMIGTVHADIGVMLGAVHVDLREMLGVLRAELTAKDRSQDDRMNALGHLLGDVRGDLSQLRLEVSGQGTSDTERGETTQNLLVDLRAAVSDAGQQAGSSLELLNAIESSIGDLRVEISSLRADFAREAETMSDRANGYEGPAGRGALIS